jgi:hypothetical protein
MQVRTLVRSLAGIDFGVELRIGEGSTAYTGNLVNNLLEISDT